MRRVGLDESQAGIKIAGRNINNLSYADNQKNEACMQVRKQQLELNMKQQTGSK